MKEMHGDGSLEELLIREGIIKGELTETKWTKNQISDR